jgi:hypothetical protein
MVALVQLLTHLGVLLQELVKMFQELFTTQVVAVVEIMMMEVLQVTQVEMVVVVLQHKIQVCQDLLIQAEVVAVLVLAVLQLAVLAVQD